MATVNISSGAIISDRTAEKINAFAMNFFLDPQNKKDFKAWQNKQKSLLNENGGKKNVK